MAEGLSKIGDDFVLIRSAQLEAHIGCTEAERASAQPLLLDIDIGIAQWEGGTDLDRSVCYATTVDLVRSRCAARSWVLVEELAVELIDAIFARFEPARTITITIKKFIVPGTEWCGVQMSRARSS